MRKLFSPCSLCFTYWNSTGGPSSSTPSSEDHIYSLLRNLLTKCLNTFNCCSCIWMRVHSICSHFIPAYLFFVASKAALSFKCSISSCSVSPNEVIKQSDQILRNSDLGKRTKLNDANNRLLKSKVIKDGKLQSQGGSVNIMRINPCCSKWQMRNNIMFNPHRMQITQLDQSFHCSDIRDKMLFKKPSCLTQ